MSSCAPAEHFARNGTAPLLTNPLSSIVFEDRAAIGRPALVGEHPARDPVQPRQRVVRNIVEPAPGHQKRLGHHVLREIAWGATERIAADCAVVLTKQLLEPVLARSFHDLAHAGYMSGTR